MCNHFVGPLETHRPRRMENRCCKFVKSRQFKPRPHRKLIKEAPTHRWSGFPSLLERDREKERERESRFCWIVLVSHQTKEQSETTVDKLKVQPPSLFLLLSFPLLLSLFLSLQYVSLSFFISFFPFHVSPSLPFSLCSLFSFFAFLSTVFPPLLTSLPP